MEMRLRARTAMRVEIKPMEAIFDQIIDEALQARARLDAVMRPDPTTAES